MISRLLRSLCFSLIPTCVIAAETNPDPATAIAEHRKGKIIVQAEPGAPVVMEQQRHEFWFGAALPNDVFGGRMAERDRETFRQVFLTNFNAAVTENALKWHVLEYRRGEVNYRTLDSMLEWTDQHALPLRGHNIFWGIPNRVQDWLKQLPDNEFRDALKNHALEIGTRYRGRFSEYDLNNEMIHGNYYEERLGKDITLQMERWVHSADSNAVLYLNDYDILTGKRLEDYLAHIRSLLDQGVRIGGIGVQGHLHGDSFDPAEVHNALQKLSKFGLPIRVTEFNFPGQRSRYYENRGARLTEAEEQAKAKAIVDYYRICFSYPQVEGILMWGFWEGANWIPQSSLYSRDWTPLPAAKAYQDLVYREWWTRWSGRADSKGRCEIPAFYGQHKVMVAGKDKTVNLRKKDGSATLSFR